MLQVPPGAGKTTCVPLALLGESWLKEKKIWMLQPRRLAARASAARMASLLGESVGETVGYHIRMDRKVGPDTKIEVMTEGILTRRIQSDPFLEPTGLVIFDEFHERNINSDLGLALCLESAEALQADLRILVMSATLDVAPVALLMENAPVIVSEGQSYPVETIYISPLNAPNDRVFSVQRCYGAVLRALSEAVGDILIFLPGAKEIRQLSFLLKQKTDPKIRVLPLYGYLSQKEQATAIRPSPPGQRKIVLATSIAETSLTIEGIGIVIDSGWMRTPRFFSGTGMTRLETIPVSRASADQRRGRAGRMSAGICYRLWSEGSHQLLNLFNTPEILCTELSGLALELAVWGAAEPGELKWLNPPPEASFKKAVALLKDLGALDEKGRITPHGRQLAAVGLHPRLAHMVVEGRKCGSGLLACRLAALMSERDFLTFRPGQNDPDIRLRLEIMAAVENGKKVPAAGLEINRDLVQRIINSSRKLLQDLNIPPTGHQTESAGSLVARAYPERVAKSRNVGGRIYRMASGGAVHFRSPCSLSVNEYIVAAHLDGNAQNAAIYLAAGYSREELERDFAHRFQQENAIRWDEKINAVRAKRRILYGHLVVAETRISDMDPEAAADILMQAIRRQGLKVLPWDKNLSSLRERVVFLKNTGRFADLPDFSESFLTENMARWLKPFLAGISSIDQLKTIDLKSAIHLMLTWEQRQTVERQAPAHLVVPSGSRIRLEYSSPAGPLEFPVLAVRLQEMFGLSASPHIAGGKIPVMLHLLSPAGRPVQITRDLASFWQRGYPEVKKDLMGRYPKHHWPDDPFTAKPTRRTKPRGK